MRFGRNAASVLNWIAQLLPQAGLLGNSRRSSHGKFERAIMCPTRK